MVKEGKAVFELLWNIMTGKTDNISRVDYIPQKPVFPSETTFETALERRTPESQGIASSWLSGLVEELSEAKQTDIHHLMVLRNGYVICECDYAPYKKGMWHTSYSMCKSITGMAIGLLVEEGRLHLDERICNIFGRRTNILGLLRKKDITVENLLTMTSGVSFNESGSVTGNDWVKSYLESAVHGTPGAVFEYNSMNTYMLSAIVTEIVGETMFDYLKPRLFEPLGIERIYWETCPKGITKGGWGLFIRPEDAAKLGQLYLQKGKWNGRQIIPEQWVVTSTEKKVDTPEEMGGLGYGYQLWMRKRPGSYIFNGMLGQNVAVYPDINVVVVVNAGSDEIFQTCVLMDMIGKYFETDFQPPDTLPEQKSSYLALKALEQKFSKGEQASPVILKGGWKKRRSAGSGRENTAPVLQFLDGRSYAMQEEHIGLLPIMMQVFHNNFTGGIKKMGFALENGRLYWNLTEGRSEYHIEIGLHRAVVNEIMENGEAYTAGVRGQIARDEENCLVLLLDIAFLEDAARRKVSIHFQGDRILAEWNETPGRTMIMEGLSSILAEISENFIVSALKGTGGMDLFALLMGQSIAPVATGLRIEEKTEPV